MTFMNCPNHSCYCRGLPFYCDSFHSSCGSFLLLVIAPPNCFNKSPESKEGAEGVECGGPPQNNGFGMVGPYNGGTMGAKKSSRRVLVEELNGSCCLNSDATHVPTSGIEQAGTDDGKRQTFGFGKGRAALVEGTEIICMYLCCGDGGYFTCFTKAFVGEFLWGR